MRVGSLFSGYDGIGLALSSIWPDAKPAWFVEFDAAPSKILRHHWPTVPNYGDVTTVDWSAVEPVEVLTAGYPCQPFSNAGMRRGTSDERHLWPYAARAIAELRPEYVVLENVRSHLSMGFYEVQRDLAVLGYTVQWVTIDAGMVGAPHKRARVFILASRLPVRAFDGDLFAVLRGTDWWAQESTLLGAGDPDRRTIYADRWPAAGNVSGTGRARAQNAPRAGADYSAARAAGWGDYAAPVGRWATATGQPAPTPVVDGQLNPALPEWMMGLPAGYVTDPAIGLTRAQQLKVLGNGVAPAQCGAALRYLIGQPVRFVPTPVVPLPTPAVNDMGEGKTVEWWDEWSVRQKSAAGKPAPHGKSLAIEALRLGAGHGL